MADKFFVDTNILIYAHDQTTGIKHDRARKLLEQLWDSGQGVLSTQILQELCINLRRKVARPLPIDDIRRLLEDYLTWEIVVNTPNSVLQALDLEARYKVSFWDALVLQAAETAGVSILYSEDLATGQQYGTFRVENPLLR